MPRSIAVALVVLAIAQLGCSPGERELSSTVDYSPPIEHSIVVETVVNLNFDQAWNQLIRRLADSPFEVSALEKASRFVRVDMARSTDLATPANKPSRYVDCGATTRVVRADANGDEERFEYQVVASNGYTEVDEVDDGYRVSEVQRRVALDSSATIYLQPEGERKTRVAVKSRYRVDVEISGVAKLVPREADAPIGAPRAFGPRVESIRFTTFKPGSDKRGGGLTCRATGAFEHALVALANPAAAI